MSRQWSRVERHSRHMHKLLPQPGSGKGQAPKVIKRIIKHLDKLSTEPNKLGQLDDFYQNSRNFTFSRKPFPALPKQDEAPHLIEKYVENITKTTFGGKIFHTSTVHDTTSALHTMIDQNLLSPAAIDMAIAHFARVGDPVTILTLMNQLDSPGLDQFNHWLYSLYGQRRFFPDLFRLRGALPILAAMGDQQVVANGQTWNMALLAMPSHFGQGTMYRAMLERAIPIDKQAANMVAKYLISVNGIAAVVQQLQQTEVSRQMVHAVIEAMLKKPDPDNANVRQAFDFMNFWAARAVKPTKSTLNIFLYQFARRRHLDWMIGIAEYFNQEYGVQMTSKSWEHMAYAVSRLNETPAKYQMVGMIFKEAIKLSLTERAKHSFRLAYKFAEKNNQKVMYPGQHVYPYLRERLNWFHWSGPPDYSRDDDAAKAAGVLGFTTQELEIKLHSTEMQDVGINAKRLWGDGWSDLLLDEKEEGEH